MHAVVYRNGKSFINASGCDFFLSFARSFRDVIFTLLLRTLLYFFLCFSVVNKYACFAERVAAETG